MVVLNVCFPYKIRRFVCLNRDARFGLGRTINSRIIQAYSNFARDCREWENKVKTGQQSPQRLYDVDSRPFICHCGNNGQKCWYFSNRFIEIQVKHLEQSRIRDQIPKIVFAFDIGVKNSR